MASVYTVSQINNYIKTMFTQDFVLNNVCVKGEISECKYHTSGHIYFTIKDEMGIMSSVMYRSKASLLKFRLEIGMSVLVKGSINIYEKSGRYQLYAESIEPDGQGDLYKQFDLMRRRLYEMGLFDDMYKKPIPKYCFKLGVCTAKTGAAVRDIINVSTRRNPNIQITLYPAQVQGEGAAEDIVRGIKKLDLMGLDTIIVGRGGGSIEDLWAFNEEIVARAIFECNTPIISAVGHETDVTIADYVADLRAPTPSAGAELAVFNLDDFMMSLDVLSDRMRRTVSSCITSKKDRLTGLSKGVEAGSPASKIKYYGRMKDDLKNRLDGRMTFLLEKKKDLLKYYIGTIEGISPISRLKKGYAYITKGDSMVSHTYEIEEGDKLDVRVVDGIIHTTVDKKERLENE